MKEYKYLSIKKKDELAYEVLSYFSNEDLWYYAKEALRQEWQRI